MKTIRFTDDKTPSSITAKIVLWTLSNHIVWSSHHVISRYLQVKANPSIHGMVVLSTGKLISMVLTYCWGDYLSSIVVCSEKQSIESSPVTWKKHRVRQALTDLEENNDDPPLIYDKLGGTVHSEEQDTASYSSSDVPSQTFDAGLSHRRIFDHFSNVQILLLNSLLTTIRASLNVVSAKYAKSYNLSLINASVIFLVPMADWLFLKAKLPPSLWPAVSWSLLGSALIAFSHTAFMDDENSVTENQVIDVVSRSFFRQKYDERELFGCTLQMISCFFIVALRLLARVTNGRITPSDLVQSANIGTFLFPAIYVTVMDPSAWNIWQSITVSTFFAWLGITVLIFFMAATVQVTLVQTSGPGFYSSFTAIRVIGSVVLSSLLLHEPLTNWLECAGLAVNVLAMSFYVHSLYKDEWGMKSRKNNIN